MKSHIDRTANQPPPSSSHFVVVSLTYMIMIENHCCLKFQDKGRPSTNEKEDAGLFGVRIAVIDETAWPHSGYTTFFDDSCAYILNSDDETKLTHRMLLAISDVLLDTNHLSAIVRRDLKQRMQPQEVAALSSSQQVVVF